MKRLLTKIPVLFFIASFFCCSYGNALAEKQYIDLRKIDSDQCIISLMVMKGQTRFDIISYVNVHDYSQMIGVSWLFSDLARTLFELGWINITSKPKGPSPYVVLIEYKWRNNIIGNRAIYLAFALEDKEIKAEYITKEWLSEKSASNVVDLAVSKIVQQMSVSYTTDDVFRNIHRANRKTLE